MVWLYCLPITHWEWVWVWALLRVCGKCCSPGPGSVLRCWWIRKKERPTSPHQNTYLLLSNTIHPSFFPSVRPSVHLSVRPSFCPSVWPSICPSVRPSIHQSFCLSVHLSVRPWVCTCLQIRYSAENGWHKPNRFGQFDMNPEAKILRKKYSHKITIVKNMKLMILSKIRVIHICSFSPRAVSVHFKYSIPVHQCGFTFWIYW